MNYFIPKAMIAVDRMSMNYILSEADASDRESSSVFRRFGAIQLAHRWNIHVPDEENRRS